VASATERTEETHGPRLGQREYFPFVLGPIHRTTPGITVYLSLTTRYIKQTHAMCFPPSPSLARSVWVLVGQNTHTLFSGAKACNSGSCRPSSAAPLNWTGPGVVYSWTTLVTGGEYPLVAVVDIEDPLLAGGQYLLVAGVDVEDPRWLVLVQRPPWRWMVTPQPSGAISTELSSPGVEHHGLGANSEAGMGHIDLGPPTGPQVLPMHGSCMWAS